MMYMKSTLLSAIAASLLQSTAALDLNATDLDSVRAAAANLTQGVFSYYQNSNTSNATQNWQVGLFPFPPYYWWESGAIWGGIMDYQALTGDTSHQQDILNAMLAQVGPNYDFVVPQQVFDEANDDQGFWIFNALTALEYDLPTLPCPNGTTVTGNNRCETNWLTLADNAFNLYVSRWYNNSDTCGGGLKWQYTPTQNGYYYKNSIANGAFFNFAARLFRYTGNQTYGEWATRVYDWTTSVGFISPDYHIFDGAGDQNGANCSGIDKTEWSYNIGVYMYGAAAMAAANANNTGGTWSGRVEGFVSTASGVFFTPFPNATGIMYEHQCEVPNNCDTDQLSFKAYLSRWMSKSALLVPSIQANVTSLLQTSATGAAASCSGLNNNTCGTRWYTNGWDGTVGLGQELTALETVQALLAPSGPKLATIS